MSGAIQGVPVLTPEPLSGHLLAHPEVELYQWREALRTRGSQEWRPPREPRWSPRERSVSGLLASGGSPSP